MYDRERNRERKNMNEEGEKKNKDNKDISNYSCVT